MANEEWTGGSGTGATPDPYGAGQPGAQPGGWQQPGAQPGGWQQPGAQPGGWQQPAYGYQPPAGPPGQWYGPPPGYPPYPAPQRTNGMAIASLVLGILWIYWIGSILALVFGYIARSQIKQRGEAGAGMALAGIILGWVGLGFLVLALIAGVASGV
jgi:Domain of unknown function (DUF4190)